MKRALALLFVVSGVARAQDPATAAPPVEEKEKEKPSATMPENGKAAPPTAAGRTGLVDWPIVPGFEVIGQYQFRGSPDATGKTQWFHLFDLPRAHAAVGGTYGPALGRLLVEAVPSASDGALVGVAGDSLVLRVREAYAGFHHQNQKSDESWGASMQAGVIPTLTIPEIEGTWMMRAVAPSSLETSGISSPADMGVSGKFAFPKRFGWIGAAFTNGEGYTSRELNRGKNLEAAFDVHPLALYEKLRPLGIFFSWVMGSQGAASARTDRWTWALLWQGVRIRGGASVTYAVGSKGDGDQRGVVLDLFARVEPIEKFLVGARVSYWNVDTRAPAADSVTTITGAVGYRFWKPLEVYLAADGSIPSNLAKTSMPATDFWDLRVIGRAVF